MTVSVLVRPSEDHQVCESLKGSKKDRSDFGKVSTMADYTSFYMHRNDFISTIEILCRDLIGCNLRANQRARTHLKTLHYFGESLHWFPAEKN